jgi:hypothetical protein
MTRREMTQEERAFLEVAWLMTRAPSGKPYWSVEALCGWFCCSTKKLAEWVKELGLPLRKPQKKWSCR